MEFVKQVVNYHISKKIFDLGFVSECRLFWVEHIKKDDSGKETIDPILILRTHSGDVFEYIPDSLKDMDILEILTSIGENIYPAYTVAELWELLPQHIEHNKNDWSSSYYILYAHSAETHDRPSEPSVWYEDNDLHDDGMILHGTGGTTEANARGQMLMWLIENKPEIFGDKINKSEGEGNK